MHLLPQGFEFQTANLLPGTSEGTATLLLPVAVRFFSKSLPHLLPRQAFCFWAMSRSKAGIELRQFSFVAHTDAGIAVQRLPGANLEPSNSC